MPRTTDELLDEILADTQNYRCEYLQVLIEKYCKPQDEVVDIHIHNLKIVQKPANYLNLKRMQEQPFGYVSSYECKTAKKTIKFWKKKVILQKRAAFRKIVGAQSSADQPTNLKYLSRNTVHKTLLAVQNDESYSSSNEYESTLNETEFDDDQTFVEADSSFSSDTLNITSKERLKEVCREAETIKTIATQDKYSFSANNVQEFANFTIKNCNVNYLKPYNHKRLDILIEKFLTVANRNSVGNGPEIVRQKVAVHFKEISSPKVKGERNGVCSAYNDYNGTSFFDYISSKSTPKFKFSDIGLGIPNKSSQTSSFSTVKSLPYVSENSVEFSKIGTEKLNENCQASIDGKAKSHTEFPKPKSKEIEMVPSDKNYQSSNDRNSKSISCAANKSTNVPKLRSREDKMATSNENCKTSQDSNTTSLSYASNRYVQFSKLRPRESGKVISNKNCQTLSDCNTESSSYVLRKSTWASKFRPRENEKAVSNKNCQYSSVCNVESSSYSSAKSVEDPSLIPADQTSNKYCGNSCDCNFESLKSVENPNLKCMQNEKLTSHRSCDKSKDSNAKSLSNASNKSTEKPKFRPKEDKTLASYKNCQISNNCDAKSLSSVSNMSVEDPILKSKEDGRQASVKDCEITSDCNSTLLFCVSSESNEDPNLKQKQDRRLTSDKNCEQPSDFSAKSSSTAPSKSPKVPKFRSYDSDKCIQVVKLSSVEDGTVASYKNCQTSSNFNVKSLLSNTSNKCTKAPKLISEESEIVTSNENCQSSSDSNARSVPYASDKQTSSDSNTKSCTLNRSTELPKLKPQDNDVNITDKIVQSCNDFNIKSLPSASTELSQSKFCKIDRETSKEYLQASGDGSTKSLSCVAKKHVEVPKLKPREDRIEASKKNFGACNVSKAKSLIYASAKSLEPRKHKYSDIGIRASSRHCQTLLNSFPLSSSFGSQRGISAEIDPLSLKRISDSKKPHKKKSSLSQSTLPFNKTKSYQTYLDGGVKVDDLSLKCPRKTRKNRHKDESLK